MKLGEVLNSINHTKEDIMRDDIDEKAYVPFIVNRGLSFFPDTLMQSNNMNMFHGVDKRMQYDYLRNSIRKRKRWSKWMKNKTPEDLDIIKLYFGYSSRKAKEALDILSDDQLESIRQDVYSGGVK